MLWGIFQKCGFALVWVFSDVWAILEKKKRERQFCLGVRVVFIQEVEEQRRIKTIAG